MKLLIPLQVFTLLYLKANSKADEKTILSFALSFVSLLVCAGNVTEQEALRKAQQFMQGRTFQQKNLRRAATANTFAQDAFYVFNADNEGGFVIVSADDRTPAVLGYADKGRLDMNRMPRNMQNWLEGYARQIQSLRSGEGTAAAPQVLGKPIDVMLTSRCLWIIQPTGQPTYNLRGERVNGSYRGIVIRNGKNMSLNRQ